ncbi:hypothetical protein LJ739_10545 [Aestuariibacter halophilus]|uniref:Tetratricopeptide repeat protein n=1 Tax=Fluctibacter halophilus TaxID=226011 RepID=A0ABS8GA47_9ALTE|nr:hypothetical protein [Aestuariibacter halophilus]MCC2616680.1 hypothetical protein [Aestuariibacter halophilus]
MSKFVKNVCAVATMTATSLLSSYAMAQQTPVVLCPNYEKGPTEIIGERAGKKLQKALEAYNNDLIDEALVMLKDIDPSQDFDKAFVDQFIGKVLAGQDGKGLEALRYLKGTVTKRVLNDREHADILRLIADLSMQEKQYQQAIDYYQRWMTFTCKEDADVYTRMANAYYETKELDKIIAPADKAIALYDKPNKNPYVLKMTSYYERKMYPETVKVAEVLVKTFPETKQWWTQLGFFYMLVEDYKRALSTFEIAYREGMLSKKSEIKALAQLYATNGIPYKAAKLLDKYLKSGLLEASESNYATLANSWHQAREYKEAAAMYAKAASFKGNADYYRKQGTLLHAAEDYKGALAALQKALDAGADQVGRIHITMMEANLYTGNFRQALVHAREAKKDSSTRRNAAAWEPYIKEKAKNRGINI